jgi:hypothetical protein
MSREILNSFSFKQFSFSESQSFALVISDLHKLAFSVIIHELQA